MTTETNEWPEPTLEDQINVFISSVRYDASLLMEGKSTSNVSTAESLNIAADDMQRALNQHRPAPATEAVGGLTDEDEGIETALRYARFIASEINSEESRHPVQDIDGEYWPARLHSLCERALNQRLAGKVGAPNLSEIVANKSAQIDALIGDPWGRTNPDTRRYQRLRILGAAPSGSDQLANGTVLRFQSLDAFLDADLDRHPSRGEPTTQAGVTEVDVDYWARIDADNVSTSIESHLASKREQPVVAKMETTEPAGIPGYKERCEHGVRWERRCFACIIEENNG